jgi:hypothetical protein
MNLNRSNNFWKLRATDPFVIKVSKIFLWVDFLYIAGLMLTLDIWAKSIANSIYSYGIVMRGGRIYYVPKMIGFTIHGGMIIWPILFIFTFSYLFWPITKKDEEKNTLNEPHT